MWDLPKGKVEKGETVEDIRFALMGGASTVLLWLLSLRFIRHPLWQELTRVGTSIGTRVRAGLAR